MRGEGRGGEGRGGERREGAEDVHIMAAAGYIEHYSRKMCRLNRSLV